MKGQSHLGILLGMNILTGVQLLCLNTPDFGESYENVCGCGWGGVGAGWQPTVTLPWGLSESPRDEPLAGLL